MTQQPGREDAHTAHRPTYGGDANGDVRDGDAFHVHLDVFEGPFDLLLSLIAKHKLDVTQLALAQVTDEFVAHIRGREDWDLSQASEFLVVAATLLDLKAAGLLPGSQRDDEEGLALLEARDLLFARLLQYKAFKEVAGLFGVRLREESRRVARSVSLETQFTSLLPELVWTLGPAELAAIAAVALTPKKPATVNLDHLHAPAVSVREQAGILAGRLRRSGSSSFRELTADADSRIVVVARFLALLELFRQALVSFEQMAAMGELTIRWTGIDRDVEITDEFDGEGTQ